MKPPCSVFKTSILISILYLVILFSIFHSVDAKERLYFEDCKKFYDQGDKDCKAKNNWCRYYFGCPPHIDKQWWWSRVEMCRSLSRRYGEEKWKNEDANQQSLLRCVANYSECNLRFACPRDNYDLSKVGTRAFVALYEDAERFVRAPNSNPQSVVCLLKTGDDIQKARCGMLTSLRTMIRLHDDGEKIIIPQQFRDYRVLIRADIRTGQFAKESKLIRSEVLSNLCTGGDCLVSKYTFMDDASNNVTIYSRGYSGHEEFKGRYFGHWVCHDDKDHFGPSTSEYEFKPNAKGEFEAHIPFEGKCIPKRRMFIVKSNANDLYGVGKPDIPISMAINLIQKQSYNDLNKNLARPQLEGR